jgi:uncharacterized protein (TIGR02271 family)
MIQSIVAVFANRDAALHAMRELESNGVARDHITVRSREDGAEHLGAGEVQPPSREQRGGFLSWLFGTEEADEAYDVPDRDRELLYRGIHERGQTVLVVRADENLAEPTRVTEIVERHDPISIDEGDGEHRDAPLGGAARSEHGDDSSRLGGFPASQRDDTTTERETVIPVTEERLDVGKRQVRRANVYRIRTTVEEVPVEEDVRLRDERVVVERRPVTGKTASGDAFQEKTVEVHETHEEPVVHKTAEQTEEVVVRKDADEHVQKVRDTVRRTRVDVEDNRTRK